MDLKSLTDERQNDPKSVGYNSPDPDSAKGRTYVQAGDCGDLEHMLNATTGPGAETIAVPSLTSDEVKKLFFPAAEAIPALDADKQAKWTRRLAYLQGVSSVSNDAEFAFILADAITDFDGKTGGMFSQARIDKYTKRPASRAEVLFGKAVTAADIGLAIKDLTDKD